MPKKGSDGVGLDLDRNPRPTFGVAGSQEGVNISEANRRNRPLFFREPEQKLFGAPAPQFNCRHSEPSFALHPSGEIHEQVSERQGLWAGFLESSKKAQPTLRLPLEHLPKILNVPSF